MNPAEEYLWETYSTKREIAGRIPHPSRVSYPGVRGTGAPPGASASAPPEMDEEAYRAYNSLERAGLHLTNSRHPAGVAHHLVQGLRLKSYFSTGTDPKGVPARYRPYNAYSAYTPEVRYVAPETPRWSGAKAQTPLYRGLNLPPPNPYDKPEAYEKSLERMLSASTSPAADYVSSFTTSLSIAESFVTLHQERTNRGRGVVLRIRVGDVPRGTPLMWWSMSPEREVTFPPGDYKVKGRTPPSPETRGLYVFDVSFTPKADWMDGVEHTFVPPSGVNVLRGAGRT